MRYFKTSFLGRLKKKNRAKGVISRNSKSGIQEPVNILHRRSQFTSFASSKIGRHVDKSCIDTEFIRFCWLLHSRIYSYIITKYSLVTLRNDFYRGVCQTEHRAQRSLIRLKFQLNLPFWCNAVRDLSAGHAIVLRVWCKSLSRRFGK